MSPRKKPHQRHPTLQPPPTCRELPLAELEAIVARAAAGPFSTDDCDKLKAAVDTLAFLTRELETKGASIQRLRKLIFGASTEKTRQVFLARCAAGADDKKAAARGKPKAKRKGHGRKAAAAYTGAEKVTIPHPSLHHGDHCPDCQQGKVYDQQEPAVLVRVAGMAPLAATVYERERLRCNLCGKVFTAAAPAGVGESKYDEAATSMIGLLKYGSGLPFHRLQRLEESLGIPLPAATQWELVAGAADRMQPAFSELIRQAAQGDVIHNDDTTMKILALDRPANAESDTGAEGGKRTGVFTSGIVATSGGHRIALFFTGGRHAGENLATVLAQRETERAPPIQASDALSRNTPGDAETIVANCLAHGRRRFVDVAEHFPDECRHVLETLREVYRHDAVAKQRELTSEQRLSFHQEHSKPLMDALETWLDSQFEQRLIEPNSSRGGAIQYMRNHWQELTLFLREPGAPLDNNICERALKRAILHRKNAYFYETENGARVGDLFMTLIHSAELEGANSFDYLVALQRHHQKVAANPEQWLPWNYTAALDHAAAAKSTASSPQSAQTTE